MLREAAYIVVGLDHCRFSKAGFDDIGVNGSLNQIVYGADFFCFLLKYTDKFFADNLALFLGIFYTL